VADGVQPRGLMRVICPGCKKRAWVQSNGREMVVVRVDKVPKKLPRGQTAS